VSAPGTLHTVSCTGARMCPGQSRGREGLAMIGDGSLTGYEIAELHGLDLEHGTNGRPCAFVDRETAQRVTAPTPVQLRNRMMEHIAARTA